LKNTKKLGLLISSKTGESLRPFIKPRNGILRGISIIIFGYWWYWMYISYSWGTLPVFTVLLIFSFYLIVGGISISRARLGNKHVLAHQILNWALPISSKTEEPLKPIIKPRDLLLRGIIVIAMGFLFWGSLSYSGGTLIGFLIFIYSLIGGCILISRAKLGKNHILAHQIIILISDLFFLIMGFVFSIILWSIPGVPGLLTMVGSIIIIIVSTLVSIIHCLYWLVKLEKYKVKIKLLPSPLKM